MTSKHADVISILRNDIHLTWFERYVLHINLRVAIVETTNDSALQSNLNMYFFHHVRFRYCTLCDSVNDWQWKKVSELRSNISTRSKFRTWDNEMCFVSQKITSLFFSTVCSRYFVISYIFVLHYIVFMTEFDIMRSHTLSLPMSIYFDCSFLSFSVLLSWFQKIVQKHTDRTDNIEWRSVGQQIPWPRDLKDQSR